MQTQEQTSLSSPNLSRLVKFVSFDDFTGVLDTFQMANTEQLKTRLPGWETGSTTLNQLKLANYLRWFKLLVFQQGLHD